MKRDERDPNEMVQVTVPKDVADALNRADRVAVFTIEETDTKIRTGGCAYGIKLSDLPDIITACTEIMRHMSADALRSAQSSAGLFTALAAATTEPIFETVHWDTEDALAGIKLKGPEHEETLLRLLAGDGDAGDRPDTDGGGGDGDDQAEPEAGV